MTVLELLSQARAKLNNYTVPSRELLAKIQIAEARVFLRLNQSDAFDEIQRGLQEEISDVVSRTRDKIVLPSDPLSNPDIFLDSKKCHIVKLGDGQLLTQTPAFKPATTIRGKTITFYPYDNFASGTLSAYVSYVRSPRKLIYLDGWQLAIDKNSAYGVKGKGSFKKMTVHFPKAASSQDYSENELVGSTVSVQTNANFVTDYLIEEHPEGRMAYFWVDTSKARQGLSPNLDFVTQPDGGGANTYLSVIHRTSDLPQRFHVLILDELVAMEMPPVVKTPKKEVA